MAKKKVAATKSSVSVKKKAAPMKATVPKEAIDALSPSRQTQVFRNIEKVLRDARVTSVLDALVFDTQAGPLICPSGTARRMVCRKDPQGVVRCVPECVPAPGV
jgi:hypothetical protein